MDPEDLEAPVEEQEDQTPTLAEMVGEAWDEHANEEDSPEAEASDEKPPVTDKESDDVVTAPDSEAKEPETEADADPLSAPEHWTAEDKELFGNSSEEVQQWIVARDKGLQADYTRKTQDLADQRSADQPLYDLGEQLKPHFAAMNVTPAQGLGQLAQAQQSLLIGTPDQRRMALEQIAQSYGISLTPGADQQDVDEYRDPEIVKLQQQVVQLQGTFQQSQQSATQQQQQADLNMVQDFATAKDEDGTLKHPHFEAVRVVMASLVGIAGSMDAAYDMATNANPETRALIHDAQTKVEKGKEEKARVERVSKAKQAAPSNTRSKTAASTTPKVLKTPKDAATAAWEELASA